MVIHCNGKSEEMVLSKARSADGGISFQEKKPERWAAQFRNSCLHETAGSLIIGSDFSSSPMNTGPQGTVQLC